MQDSIHFDDMLKEREIKREWADGTARDPDPTEEHDDGTKHFIKQIPEFGDRWLRVVELYRDLLRKIAQVIVLPLVYPDYVLERRRDEEVLLLEPQELARVVVVVGVEELGDRL